MYRIGIALLLVAAFATADVKDAYNKVKRKRAAERKLLGAELALQHEGSVKGTGYIYLGLLWQYAQEWDKAVEAFRGYLRGAKPKAKSRPLAVLEITNSQVSGGKYAEAAATAKEFLEKFKNHRHTGRLRYCQGRALRAQGDAEGALTAFQAGHNAKNTLCAYEVADSLMQLGRYSDIKAHAATSNTEAARWKTVLAALPNLGKPLPKKLDIDYWAGRDLGMGEIKSKPTLWSFWTTKVGNARDSIHNITNEIAQRFAGKMYVLGPALYVQFNPIDMKSIPDMGKEDEQSYIQGWKDEYKLKYDLIVLNDHVLHNLCGIDPAYPALPAFAMSDKKGVLRYVRVGPEAATNEALAAMSARLMKE